MIITLCGSTRFEKEFHYWNELLTLDGHVVFSIPVYPSTKPLGRNWPTNEQRRMLEQTHKLKIDLSHAIFVIDRSLEGGTYISETTLDQIKYARDSGKMTYYSSVACGYHSCPSRFVKPRSCHLCQKDKTE